MIELNKIYQGDCMEYMKDIPDNYFELAIVDPPYGINAYQGTNRASRRDFADKSHNWDAEIPSENYFDELKRISEAQIIWGGNYFLKHLGETRGFVIWDKLNPDRCFADCEFAWNSIDVVARIFKGRPQTENKKDGGKIHPTQKPVALYKWLLKNYAKEGDKILDTHLGSASSVIACIDMGFDFVGIELDEEYYTKALERVNNHLRQGDLTRDQKFQSLQL